MGQVLLQVCLRFSLLTYAGQNRISKSSPHPCLCLEEKGRGCGKFGHPLGKLEAVAEAGPAGPLGLPDPATHPEANLCKALVI